MTLIAYRSHGFVMKDKLNIRIAIIVTLALAIFASFSVVITNYAFMSIQLDDADFLSEVIVDEILASDDGLLNAIDKVFERESIQKKVRVTLFSSDSTILSDSTNSFEPLTNKEKQKFEAALGGAASTEFGHSDANSVDRIECYKSFRYNNDIYVLRLRVRSPSVTPYLIILLPVLLIAAVAVILSMVRLNISLNKNVIYPLSEATKAIEDMSRDDYKPLTAHSGWREIESLLTRLNYFNNKQINARTLSLTNKKKVNFLIEELSVGVVAFDTEGKVLLSNNTALMIFGATKNIIGGDLREFIRDDQLINKIYDKINAKSSTAFTYHINEKLFRVEIVLIPSDEINSYKKDSAVLFTDITAESMLDTMRSEFFSNASHELKTPITAILGFSELLMLRSDIDAIKPLIDNIQRNSRKMYELIQDMMELSRLDANSSGEKEVIVDMRDLAEFACASLTPLADSSNVRFRLRGACFVRGKHKLMEQLITNLISNAVKYNVPDGKVYVELSNDGVHSIIKVRDSGRGIPTGDLPRVFERFFCVDKGRTRSSNSTGLGLAIVKEIVSMHSGQIILESIYGKGTQFTIEFPSPTAIGDVSPIEYDDDTFDTESKDIFGNDKTCTIRRIDEIISLRERVE